MTQKEPIAVVGIGGRFPGSPDPEAFWAHVEAGADLVREVPAGRWALDPDRAFDPRKGRSDRVYSRGASLIEDTGASRDPELPPGLDPMIHLLLQAGQEAWHDAVTAGVDRRRVGVILGNIALPTESSSALADWVLGRRFEGLLFQHRGVPRPEETRHPAAELNRWVTGLPAGLLARRLGLGGGHYTLDAACASSLFALKLAADELQAGRADAMLTGGLSRPDCLYTQMGFSQLGALSPSGRCSPFDLRGDGLVVGEGAGVLVLKRLADAVRAGDRVHAVIRGIGLSNDVDGTLLAPSREGQLRAMRAAYERAGWQPQDVDLIECHATGTPIGDATEYGSLRALWGGEGWAPGQCVIGSVKSNVGHLLTGAGAAGLVKVMLALRHEVLPPTANFEQPASGIDLAAGPFRVLAKSEPWPRRGGGVPRRAAVSGFGFGGTNAHVLLEEHAPASGRSVAVKLPDTGAPAIAIVGMDAAVGPWQGLAPFQRRVLGGGGPAGPAPKQSYWGLPDPPQGWFIEQLEIPVGEFRIPPKELEESLPQQTLMLQVAKRALEDAGLEGLDRLRTGVFIGIGLDLNTTSYHLRWSLRQQAPAWARALGLGLEGAELERWIDALCDLAGPALNANRTMGALGGIVASRIAREFGLGGPSFVLGSEETSGFSALEAAVRALQAGELEAALVGAVDLTADPRAVLATDLLKPFSRAGVVRPFDLRADGTLLGEGAAAVVLRREDDARSRGHRIYAAIRGIGSATGGSVHAVEPDVPAYLAALGRAYAEAGIEPASVGYLETHGSGHAPEDRVEAEALAQFFDGEAAPALGSVKPDVGHTGAASFLVSLVKAGLCLYQEILPPLRGLEQPRERLTRFPRPKGPQYWLHDTARGPRRAGVSGTSVSGNHGHVVLEECPGAAREPERQQPLGPCREALFAIEADDEAGLSQQLQQLARSAADAGTAPVAALARVWWNQRGQRPEAKLGAGIVARDPQELARLVEIALAAVQCGAELAGDRVFYSPRPLGPEAQVAFVFPGSGSQYPGMGREISAQWPEVLRAQQARWQYLRSQLAPEQIWNAPRGSEALDARTLILAQVALGTVVSDLLRRFVQPTAVLGYSLGETTALFSMGAWQDRDEMLRRVMDSPLFVSELTGPCDAARRAWQLPRDVPIAWSVGVVDRPAAAVREALQGVERAYLLIVNTPDECVVGGQTEAVQDLVRRLGSSCLPLHGITTVHCEAARPVEAAYRELHLMPTSAPPGVRFYSGAWGKAYDVDRESAAGSIVAQALGGLDFPRVVRQAWDDGVRLFVETGPGGSCTRMITKILQGQRFAARAVCVEGQDAVSPVLRVLGMLLAERADVRLGQLYAAAPEVEAPAPRRSVVVRVGGAGFGPFDALPEAAAKQTADSAQPASTEVRPGPSHVESPRFANAEVRPGPAQGILAIARSGAQAHDSFLRLAAQVTAVAARQAAFQMELAAALSRADEGPSFDQPPHRQSPSALSFEEPPHRQPASLLDRGMCLEFAAGSIARVLGPEFAPVDAHPTRVRLPDEPLMLVDRILEIAAQPRSMSPGRVVTEHDVLDGAWYLDAGRIPTCIAVEAGQADLFLSAYLGIDFLTKGLSVYRLLDATVSFHDELPRPGQTIRYDIAIEGFFQQAGAWLFRFRFDATVDGRLLLTMRDGCAGFFTQAELDAGKGILRTRLDRQPRVGILPEGWRPLAPMPVQSLGGTELQSLGEAEMQALRAGDLAAAFGEDFAGLGLERAATIPGGPMRLVHRVKHLDPRGGRYGLGTILAEADVHPDDWFLTCHFVDDRVMPGTLMYECCLHTLRILLLRMGWIGEEGSVVCQPAPGVKSRLKCRGQVLESTKVITYEISVKELGYGPEPYAVAAALMYADGKPIVEIGDMSLRMSGLDKDRLERLWASRDTGAARASGQPAAGRATRAAASGASGPQHPEADGRNAEPRPDAPAGPGPRPALYDSARILAFSGGNPSEAFGAPYRVFDAQRRIARLPRPPFQFLDRITAVEGEPFQMTAGARCEAQVAVLPDAWHFASNRQRDISFAVLLEIALQPCGWLAAYVGSALHSDVDLKFRNLGGDAVLHAPVLQEAEVLTTTAALTGVSKSGGMIIQHYSFSVLGQRRGKLYEGTTYFGFFSQQALAEQVGLRDVQRFVPDAGQTRRGMAFDLPHDAPFPERRMRMVDRVDLYVPDVGPDGLGFIRGSIAVDPALWFFDAHFYQDPVWPGSLGLEAFLQLLKAVAARRWGSSPATAFSTMPLGARHQWVYRGQVVPACKLVEVEACITAVDDARHRLTADGLLLVDGRPIYQMKNFALEARA